MSETAEAVKLADNELRITAPKVDKEVVITFDWGSDLNDKISRWGDEVVESGFDSSQRIALQGRVRSCLEKGGSPEDCQALADKFEPGVSAPRGFPDKRTVATEFFKNMSKDEQKEFLAGLA